MSSNGRNALSVLSDVTAAAPLSPANTTICEEWDKMLNDFCLDLTEEEVEHRYKVYREEDLSYTVGDNFDNLVKCEIKDTVYDKKEVGEFYTFSSPVNIMVFFSDPLKLAVNLISGDIIDYVMYNVEDGSVKIKIETECDAYRKIDNWRILLTEIKRLAREANKWDPKREIGFFLDLFNDGVLLTLVTHGEAHKGELPEETRAAVFLCKPRPVTHQDD